MAVGAPASRRPPACPAVTRSFASRFLIPPDRQVQRFSARIGLEVTTWTKLGPGRSAAAAAWPARVASSVIAESCADCGREGGEVGWAWRSTGARGFVGTHHAAGMRIGQCAEEHFALSHAGCHLVQLPPDLCQLLDLLRLRATARA